jgi:hypothetical protein
MSGEHSTLWLNAMKEEMESMVEKFCWWSQNCQFYNETNQDLLR